MRAQEIRVLPVTPGSAPGQAAVLWGHHGTLVRRAQDTSSPRWLQAWEGVKCVKLHPSVSLCQRGVCLPSGTPPHFGDQATGARRPETQAGSVQSPAPCCTGRR